MRGAFAPLMFVAACGSFSEADRTEVTPPDAAAPDAGSISEAGADASDAGGIGCNRAADCERVVFVTKGQYFPDELGGLAGATQRCNDAASVSTHVRVRGRRFVPWLSAGGVSPSTTFVHGTKAYIRPSGAVIAASWAELVSGVHSRAINEDENGTPNTQPFYPWTATAADGTAKTDDCAGWTTRQTGNGIAGRGLALDAEWTDGTSESCGTDHGIYCFED